MTLLVVGSMATAPTWLGSDSVCSGAFLVAVAAMVAMLVFAFASRGKAPLWRWCSAIFPPALALMDIVLGASWSLLFMRPEYESYGGYRTMSRLCYGIDQTTISILCASFELLFALEALRGPRLWQRGCGVLFAIHSVAVLVYMPIRVFN